MIKIILAGLLLSVSSVCWSGTVDINNADVKTIAAELKGIGAKKAQAIIDYRDANGAFVTIDDLAKVKGISHKTIEKNKENIVLGSN